MLVFGLLSTKSDGALSSITWVPHDFLSILILDVLFFESVFTSADQLSPFVLVIVQCIKTALWGLVIFVAVAGWMLYSMDIGGRLRHTMELLE